jgi:dipeptidyl-peptidase-4
MLTPTRAARALAATALLLTATIATAQSLTGDAGLDTRLSRIFRERAYDVPRFGPARWVDDGSGYTTLERASGAKAPDLVRYDTASGERRVLVPASRLVPEGATEPLEMADYAWSADGRRLLVFTNTVRVWRRNTRGDYWVLDLASGRLRKLGGSAAASTLMFAKFSPDGSRVAYVRANDIFVERLDDGRITRLTTDGSSTTINGTSDWVYEEELDVRDGFRWSPDGRHIAYWQFDTTGVGEFSLINDTDTLYPVVTRYAYPKVGTTNSAVRVGVVEAGGGKTRWMRTEGDPRQTYIARVDWRDAGTLVLQQLDRLQQRNDVLLADARTGVVRRLFRDQLDSWVEPTDRPLWIDAGRAFLIASERGAWRHVLRVNAADGQARGVTPFEADAMELSGVDERAGWLYVTASPANATQRYLYRSKLDGAAAPDRVTPAAQSGWHEYDIAPDGRHAFHTWSRADRPPVVEVVEMSAHRTLRTLTDTTTLEAALTEPQRAGLEFFQVQADGVTFDGWMIKPASFDPARTYPVIVYVYGEPASQTVVDRWGGSRTLFHRALADAGYVVVSVDTRGTPASKGTAWRKMVYGSIGDLSSREHAAATRAVLAKFPFLDASRVGLWGWSGGGTSTLNGMFRHPDLYHVGVSVAPVPDQRLYDTIYQERYMGLPDANAAGYKAGSPIHYAGGLNGKLLIVHGSGDDNVHYQGTERLINTLIELGKPFDMMAYPNRTHAIAEGPGTSLHLHALVARYFLSHLRAGASAPANAGNAAMQGDEVGFVPLFDGRTLTGWDGDTARTWRIAEGALVGGSLTTRVPRNEFLAAAGEYADFVLKLQFRLRGTDGFINAGVQVRSQRIPDNHEMVGYQLDLGDPAWWGTLYDESRRNRALAQSDIEAVRRVLRRDDWNDYEIRCEGRRIVAFINGVQTIDYTETDPSIPLKGRIALQVHGGGAAEASYRNIRVRPLR